MKLILAEKPSVAQSIAKVLGATKRHDGYLEGNDYLVSWCVGHLVELAAPEAYDERYGKWRLADLPILPENWIYQVSPSTRKQFGVLKELMKRPGVESLVNCCDAGREGELIFRLVYHQARCKKPFERLWISSMEDEAIREGFRNLKPGTEYDALHEAALCRERADWIVGMNATRLFSCLYGQTLNVGRVMTPALGMAVFRETEIREFKPETFYTVHLKTPDFEAVSERMKDKTNADEILTVSLAAGRLQVESVDRKEKKEKAPALYDLTSLQRDANRILGFTAQQTLDYTQSLYEKKLVTYPRTDSRYLTEDMAAVLPDWLNQTASAFGVKDFKITGQDLKDNKRIRQVINGKKVTDHHAIIPTRTCSTADLSGIPSGEMKILRLIAARFLAAVCDPYCCVVSTVKLLAGEHSFQVTGKEVLYEGWKSVYGYFGTSAENQSEQQELKVLPSLQKGDVITVTGGEMKEGKTSPPKRFTEDLMLSRMESAGKDDMPKDAERKGLGTPATRAGIIEKLVKKGFLERKGDKKTKYLVPTDRGNALITVMPELIRSPAMTADWEQKLLQIERGQYDPEAFMAEITEMIEGLVKNYEAVKGAKTLMGGNKVIGKCPHCGADVIEKSKGWFCSNRECRFVLWKDHAYFRKLGKHLTGHIAEQLVCNQRARMKDCRSEKTGKTYNATVVLAIENDGSPRFSLEFDSQERKGKNHA